MWQSWCVKIFNAEKFKWKEQIDITLSTLKHKYGVAGDVYADNQKDVTIHLMGSVVYVR